MEYSITALAKISGVSSRTLRYYDQIGLLKPQRINSAGYRIYGGQQVDRLQQILYFKSFGLPLEEIRHLLDDPEQDVQTLLVAHYNRLSQERAALDRLLTTLAQTINYYEGEQTMSDKKNSLILNNKNSQPMKKPMAKRSVPLMGKKSLNKAIKNGRTCHLKPTKNWNKPKTN